ncbi:MAG: hypothetical protein ACHQ0J_15555, partial [Candidatus Dormibacterales bacterium]
MRGAAAIAATVVLLASACSSSSTPTFTVAGASVDAGYVCPSGSSNAPYDLHGKLDMQNQTTRAVAIQSIKAVLT